ncbi:peptidase M15 [Paenibacillus bovis]|uniref:serine-type D-Ala-D-Ala carboxypeptidase n=2 Tax=Paenibacillus bovis TaxID=1616788 RepID=A0A172ZLS6_9BACL|nr:D-alanyl-D-alanine carboxypeptidase family protein [Paenibacillus bovis]ANF98601.1 peptidase M15 [Paenibacillus bovis]
MNNISYDFEGSINTLERKLLTQKGKKSKRQLIKKSVASLMLVNMLCISTIIPTAAMAASATSTNTSTDTKSTEAADTKTGAVSNIKAPELQVKSAVLMEASTGKILLSINSDEALPPASMSKMMTEYLVSDYVKQGKLKWDDVVTVSENAAAQIGSRVFLAAGDKHTVLDLYKAMAIGSANDASVALAEQIGGTEKDFVKLMNAKAKEFGMKTAHFANATGLNISDMPEASRPDDGKETIMSAMDTAILARHIVDDHPDFSDVTSIQSFKFRPTDKDPVVNWNWMLESNSSITNFKAYAYPGLDGLKTGHTAAAKQCFTGTAERNGMRLISVVMGAETEAERFKQTKKVLDYGFDNFEVKQIIGAKSAVSGLATIPVVKGAATEVPVVTDAAVNVVVPKGTEPKNVTYTVAQSDEAARTAPIAASKALGTITYTYKNDSIAQDQVTTVNLIAAEPVEKGSWLRLFFRSIGDLFGDLFDSVKNMF